MPHVMDPTGALELMAEFDKELSQALGDLGNHQFLIIALLLFPAMYSSFIGKDYVFSTEVSRYRCYVPGCDELTGFQFSPSWYDNAFPTNASMGSVCSRYANITTVPIIQVVEDACPASYFDRSTLLPCEIYIYEKWEYYMTEEFTGLHCNRKLETLPGFVTSLGGIIAFPIAGVLSDYYGRRTALVVLAFNGALFGVLKGFSETFSTYLTFQFIQICFSGGLFSVCFVLSFEVNHPKYRAVSSAMMFTIHSLGYILLCLAGAVEKYWRTYTWSVFGPGFALIAYQLLLTESYRWLLSAHKMDMAKSTLLKVARQNGKKISAKTMHFLLNAIPLVDAQLNTKHVKTFCARVWKSPVLLRRLCIVSVMWFLTIITHKGLGIYPFPFSNSRYTNFVISEAMEIPGFMTATVLLKRYGRKSTLVIANIVCGLSCLVYIIFLYYATFGSVLFYVTAKYTAGLVILSLYLFSCELFPTRYRNLFLGILLMAGSVGSLASHWVPQLIELWEGFPCVLFGTFAIMTALLTFALPEMLGKKVPDTFEEAEYMTK